MNKAINIEWIVNRLKSFLEDNRELSQKVINCLFYYKQL